MQWFRLHHEARTDRKLQNLSDAQFRVWFNLMCFASESHDRGTIDYDDLDVLAVEVANADTELLRSTLSRLVKLRIISETEQVLAFIAWDSRQYDKPSDSPERVSQRVRDHRERKRNAGVTPSNTIDTDTDTDTDTDSRSDEREKDMPAGPKRKRPNLTGFTDWYDRYPLKVSRADAERAWSKLSPGDRQAALDGLLAQQHWPTMQRGYEFLKHPATWLNKRCWEDEKPPDSSATPGRPRMPLPNGWDYEDVKEWRARKAIGARITPEKERLLEQIDAYNRGESPEQPGSGASSSGLAAD